MDASQLAARFFTICGEASIGGRLSQFLSEKIEFSQSEIESFRSTLEKSGAPSVDLFLENNPQFEKIGKLAIAAQLIPLETYEAFKPSQTMRWYEFLFGLMVEGGRFEDNQLSILTFNYDRSIEAFFFSALCNLYGLNPAQALNRLAQIRVVHLHGSLGDRLWNDGSTTEQGYDPILTAASAHAAAKRIKIMHEVEPGDEFTTAKALLAMAEEIVFLGFGFHTINLQRLGLPEIIDMKARGDKPAQWFASRTGMGLGDIVRARKHLPRVDVGFAPESEWNILDFLKNTRCLLG